MPRQITFTREYVINYSVSFECDNECDEFHTCDGWEEAKGDFDTEIYLPDYESDVVDEWEE